MTIDPRSGVATLGAVLSGDANITGLAFSSDGELFALELEAGLETFLSRIDVDSGEVTRLFDLDVRTNAVAQSLARGPEGLLYSWSTFFGLVTIDPTSGVVTDVNPGDGNPLGPPAAFPQSLEFAFVGAAEDRLFAVVSEVGSEAFLYEILLPSGTPRLIGIGDYSSVRGLAFLPQCSDGFDNDGDGQVDSDDAACTDPEIDSEGSALELLRDLVSFIDSAARAGTLRGNSNGNERAGARLLNAFTNRIRVASFLVGLGLEKPVCAQLQIALLFADQEPRPRDLITGTATAEVAAQIEAARAALRCRPKRGDSVQIATRGPRHEPAPPASVHRPPGAGRH